MKVTCNSEFECFEEEFGSFYFESGAQVHKFAHACTFSLCSFLLDKFVIEILKYSFVPMECKNVIQCRFLAYLSSPVYHEYFETFPRPEMRN